MKRMTNMKKYTSRKIPTTITVVTIAIASVVMTSVWQIPQATASSVEEIKASREARTVFDALTALGSAPKRGAQAWVDAFARRGSVLVANLPGPGRPVSIASHPVEGMMLWVPSTGPVGLAVSVCSYAGEVRFGITADAAVMPDASKLADALETEVRAVTTIDAD